MRRRPRRVAILGGGWAGLACAEALDRQAAASGQSLRIDLFEAAPHLGGRARGLSRPDGSPPIDNGQHLLLGAYRETLGLLRRVGAVTESSWQRSWLAWQPEPRLRLADLRSAPGLALSLWRGQGDAWQAAASGSLLDWASHLDLRPSLVDGLLRPLAEAALNTRWQDASARVFRSVLHDSLAQGPWSLAAWHPRTNLTDCGIQPMARHLERRGIGLHTRARVAVIEPRPDGGFCLRGHPTSSTAGQQAMTEPYEAIVLALPARASRQLWQSSGLPDTAESRRWDWVMQDGLRGIATLWVHLPHSPASFGTTISPGRVYCLPGGQGEVLIGLARPPGPWGQVLSLVASAVPHEAEPSASVGPQLEQRMRTAAVDWLRRLGWPTSACTAVDSARWVHDPLATWACTATACDSGRAWGSPDTGLPGVWRASDDGVPDYPATIESSVRSALSTSRALLQEFQRIG